MEVPKGCGRKRRQQGQKAKNVRSLPRQAMAVLVTDARAEAAEEPTTNEPVSAPSAVAAGKPEV